MKNINKHIDLKTQKNIVNHAIDLQRDNLRDVINDIRRFEAHKDFLLEAILSNRREMYRIEKDMQREKENLS